jgi:RNA polymerase sigma factor (sigma-70 family)
MPSTEPTDDELMRAYAQGSASAFDRLYERHRQPLYRFVRRLLGPRQQNQTDEVFQDTWLRVIQARARWAPQGASFRTWLFTLGHHRAVDCLRKSGREFSLDTTDDDAAEPWQPQGTPWQHWPQPGSAMRRVRTEADASGGVVDIGDIADVARVVDAADGFFGSAAPATDGLPSNPSSEASIGQTTADVGAHHAHNAHNAPHAGTHAATHPAANPAPWVAEFTAVSLPMPSAAAEVPGPAEQAFWRAAGQRLLDCLNELPETQKAVFLLHHEDGFSLNELATSLQLGFETAKSRLRYAMAKLRTCMGAYLPTPDGAAPP